MGWLQLVGQLQISPKLSACGVECSWEGHRSAGQCVSFLCEYKPMLECASRGEHGQKWVPLGTEVWPVARVVSGKDRSGDG